MATTFRTEGLNNILNLISKQENRPLDAQRNAEYISKYQSMAEGVKKTQVRDNLILRNLAFVYGFCKQYTRSGQVLEDMLIECIPALMGCLDTFDATMGYTFTTWLKPHIQEAIFEFFRGQTRVKLPRKAIKFQKIVEAEEKRLKRVLSEEELTELSLSVGYHGQYDDLLAKRWTQLDEPIGEDGEARIDFLASEENEDRNEEIKGFFKWIEPRLKPKEQEILLAIRRVSQRVDVVTYTIVWKQLGDVKYCGNEAFRQRYNKFIFKMGELKKAYKGEI